MTSPPMSKRQRTVRDVLVIPSSILSQNGSEACAEKASAKGTTTGLSLTGENGCSAAAFAKLTVFNSWNGLCKAYGTTRNIKMKLLFFFTCFSLCCLKFFSHLFFKMRRTIRVY